MEKPSEDTLRQFSQVIKKIYGVQPYDVGFQAGEKAGALKALKEFAERLKAEYEIASSVSVHGIVTAQILLDDYIKELEGDK